METSSISYGGRQRLCNLSQLSPELVVTGPHVQEAGGRLQVAPLPHADELSITIRPDAVRSTKAGAMEDVFLTTEETTTSRLLASWHRAGVSGVLEDLASGRVSDGLPGWARRLVALVTTLIRLPYTASISSLPASAVSAAPAGAVVRRVAWHPHTARLAVVLRDDSVRVYQTQAPTVPLIKHRLQRRVADLHWKPHSASLLAVACERCVLVWTVEPNSVITRPSGSCAQTLTAPGHAPVTCVQWSPMGDLLLSASPRDGAVILWNVSEEAHVPLSRVWWLGNSFCRWSPDASKVLGATTGQTFRVWETVRWTDERYRGPVAGARLTAACWSPDGRTALFTTSAEPVVYSLSFVPILLNDSTPKPVAVIDLSASPPDAEETREARARRETLRVGSEISGMSWDKTGRRLAISFVDSNAVALFSTELHPHLRVTPCGVIRGSVDELVMDIAFQQNLQDTVSFCVAWSSGRIQQVPMLVSASARAGVLGLLAAAAGPATPLRPSAAGLLSPGSILSPAAAASRLASSPGSLLSPGGAAGSLMSPGGAAGSLLSPGGAAGSLMSPGRAAGSVMSPGGAAGSVMSPGGVHLFSVNDSP